MPWQNRGAHRCSWLPGLPVQAVLAAPDSLRLVDAGMPGTQIGAHTGNGKRGIEANARVNAGNNGKTDSLWNKRKRHNNARENIATNVREPFPTVG